MPIITRYYCTEIMCPTVEKLRQEYAEDSFRNRISWWQKTKWSDSGRIWHHLTGCTGVADSQAAYRLAVFLRDKPSVTFLFQTNPVSSGNSELCWRVDIDVVDANATWLNGRLTYFERLPFAIHSDSRGACYVFVNFLPIKNNPTWPCDSFFSSGNRTILLFYK